LEGFIPGIGGAHPLYPFGKGGPLFLKNCVPVAKIGPRWGSKPLPGIFWWRAYSSLKIHPISFGGKRPPLVYMGGETLKTLRLRAPTRGYYRKTGSMNTFYRGGPPC